MNPQFLANPRSSRIVHAADLACYRRTSTYRDAQRRAGWTLVRHIGAVWFAGAMILAGLYVLNA